MKKTEEALLLEGNEDGNTEGIAFVLAGLEGRVREFDLFGLSLQRLSDGAFRCIFRGSWKAGSKAGIRLVSFTNGESAYDCLELAAGAFRDGKLRWHVDQYANGVDRDGDSEEKQGKFSLVD